MPFSRNIPSSTQILHAYSCPVLGWSELRHSLNGKRRQGTEPPTSAANRTRRSDWVTGPLAPSGLGRKQRPAEPASLTNPHTRWGEGGHTYNAQSRRHGLYLQSLSLTQRQAGTLLSSLGSWRREVWSRGETGGESQGCPGAEPSARSAAGKGQPPMPPSVGPRPSRPAVLWK